MKIDWWWWIRNLCHIETLFVIGLVTYALYVVWKGKVKSPLKYQRPPTYKRKKAPPKKYAHEEKCREIMQKIFEVPFVSMRPKWLRNPETGKCLELDIYNPSIKTPLGKGLAVEYDGIQHSKYSPHFHKTPDAFEKQVKRDLWKDKRCKEQGILLLRVPHIVAYQDLERYILQKLKGAGMEKFLKKGFYD